MFVVLKVVNSFCFIIFNLPLIKVEDVMINQEIRKELHELLDKANENQLEVILEVLKPSPSRYSQEEIDSFYHRINLFEESSNDGYSVNDSHTLIRDKHNQKSV